MTLEEEKMFGKINCHPICNHDEICVRCGYEKCIKRMKHTRLHGYMCFCGSQQWKPLIGSLVGHKDYKIGRKEMRR